MLGSGTAITMYYVSASGLRAVLAGFDAGLTRFLVVSVWARASLFDKFLHL